MVPCRGRLKTVAAREGLMQDEFAGMVYAAHDAYRFMKKIDNDYENSCMLRTYNDPKTIHPQRQRLPLARDVSYPDEYYDDDLKQKQAEEQPLDRNSRNSLLSEYYNLCETVTRKVQLVDSEYEYQPPIYQEVYCKNYPIRGDSQTTVNSLKQECVYPGSQCVQKWRTLVLVKRPWGSECWEPYTKEIASGCECMWEKPSLGDIAEHY
ncbi:PREDICTED: uncharacterized protein LOC107189313 [Dufourea novaeangliae]|uniref:uncharacterized protein LOC107189313 n=1 Tax=Dufourea novaeangliae TaxID=178035 RepID=UPI0007670D35|nr:PREDICTED: uncharacterized protein LOC107189313 [Dufourea novaeangliae]